MSIAMKYFLKTFHNLESILTIVTLIMNVITPIFIILGGWFFALFSVLLFANILYMGSGVSNEIEKYYILKRIDFNNMVYNCLKVMYTNFTTLNSGIILVWLVLGPIIYTNTSVGSFYPIIIISILVISALLLLFVPDADIIYEYLQMKGVLEKWHQTMKLTMIIRPQEKSL